MKKHKESGTFLDEKKKKKSKTGTRTKKSKSQETDWSWEISEEKDTQGQSSHTTDNSDFSFSDLSAEIEESQMTQSFFGLESESTPSAPKARDGKRRLNIVLEYDKKTKFNVSQMLRESIAARGALSENYNDPEYVARTYYNLGKIPAWILCGDEDRWQQFIFCAEVIREHPEYSSLGVEELKDDVCGKCGLSRNRKFGKNERQVEIDGTVWGEEEMASKANVPIREQMETRKVLNVAKTQTSSFAAPVDEDFTDSELALQDKWKKAEKWANRPRANWEGQVDFEFEAMIKYCYGWLKDIGEVPQPYPFGTIDLFWQRPKAGELDMSELAVGRRNYITAKTMKMWNKWLKDPDKSGKLELGRRPVSYRVVLAAQELSTLIETYATPDDIHGFDDLELQERVKKATIKYFKAHMPITTQGVKPGPIETLDPGYVEYIRLCRKYSLRIGTLLHKVEL